MRVEQLLHGYSDGHRLLAASRDLSRAAKHLMLTISDMSGRSIVPGFEEYLTAYPVPESDCYAFAKTWYAPEMERPGCVWTHTLLIQLPDVAQVRDLSSLQALFRRPGGQAALEQYAHAVEIPESEERTPPKAVYELAVPVLSALYATPEAPVLVPVDRPASLEELVVALWNQQWPQLRAVFSFCTGSMSSRSIGGHALDLQLIPDAAVREVRRDLPSAVLVDPTTSLHRSRFAQWLIAAATDLANPAARQFRGFLWRFGDVLGGRAAFEPLAQLSSCVEEAAKRGGSLESLVEVIGERFPQVTQAQKLKVEVLGPSARISMLLFSDKKEADLLRVIGTTKQEPAFDPEALEIEARTLRLWSQDRSQAEWLTDQLLSGHHNALGERLLAALVTSVPAEELTAVFAGKPSMLVSAVRRDPVLATRAALWAGPPDLQRELFDAATAGRNVTRDVQRGIITAMLDRGSEAAAEQVLWRFGEQAIAVVLDWFDDHGTDPSLRLPEGWRRCLTQHPRSVADWTVAAPLRKRRSLALASQVLDPHAADVHRAGLDVWIAATTNGGGLSGDEQTRLHAFALALAFDVSAPEASTLTVSTFETVHNAVSTGQLTYDAWWLFENHLPFLSLWRNWDKCERLRRGLVDRFERNGWPVNEFVRCAQRRDTFCRLLQTCADFKPQGKQLLRTMRHQRQLLEAALPSDWVDAFREYVN